VADLLEDTIFPGNELVLRYDGERRRQGFRQGIGHPDICRERHPALPTEVRSVGIVRLAFRAFHDQLTLADDRILSPLERPVNCDSLPVVCAQIVPKICQRYQNVSKDIELYRNAGDLQNGSFAVEVDYYLHVSFFRRFLHTVEVRGSNPLSPISFLSTTHPLLEGSPFCHCG